MEDKIIIIYSSALMMEVVGPSEILACPPTTQCHILLFCRHIHTVFIINVKFKPHTIIFRLSQWSILKIMVL